MQVTIFTANCIGQAANCSYPNKVTVVTPEQLREAVKADHVCAEYKGNYRGIGNFIRSDVIVMDIDNDHSEESAEWITAEKLEGIFPDMEYMLASSRHHLLPKEGKSARPRYHIYFPISEITDAEVYGNLKKALQKEYPFFDGNALDAARFIFGADCEEVLVHDGWMTIDEEIDVRQFAEEEDFDAEDLESTSGGQILEGSRNNTMSRFAGRVLKRYGIRVTDQCLKELYLSYKMFSQMELDAEMEWKLSVYFEQSLSRAHYIAKRLFEKVVSLEQGCGKHVLFLFTVALHEYVVESVELAGLIAAHGDTTASSIAKVVNQACGTFVFEAIEYAEWTLLLMR